MPQRIQHHSFQILLLAATLLATLPAAAQTTVPSAPMAAGVHPSFAVAAIHPHDPASAHQGFKIRDNRVTIQNESIPSLMVFAYAIHPEQIAGLPDALKGASFDIEGRADAEGEPNLAQMQEMIQTLLADRFGLHFHREQRLLPIYAMTIAKGGPKLTPAADPKAQVDQRADGNSSSLTQTYTSASIADFILGMQFFLDRPIVDQTGLTGRYDIHLTYTPNEANTTNPNAAPGIFTAIQEQLGLKLEAIKGPVQVFVIDHVEQPSPN